MKPHSRSLTAGKLALCTALLCCAWPAVTESASGLKNVTLEMSLKPFKVMDEEYIAGVCTEMFRQWWPLTRHADGVSVLLWTADGSEILDYKGSLDEEMEWARYIGTANSKYAPGTGPEELSLHERPYLYTENPPVITYGRLRDIVGIIKRVGQEVTGKPVRVGATFDPGPEFAKSPFKYEKHPEICLGNTMGKATFVCCYSTLKADTNAYAGYPGGIPEGTPFGAFFGKQSHHFLTDLGFDYLWLSNGFGFGVETWGVTGAVFNGETFDNAQIGVARDKILQFWSLFRQECPKFLVETRGTNLSTGIDLASDGVPLRSVYRGGFNMAPPPNSPWAALDGDFGLELTGYMSHMAEIPGEDYPFRYYTHDPWWLNSPWLDRYGREPHDIYLPMAVARVNAEGAVKLPSSILFLTVDNSFGEMPVEVPNEVIPHILRARADAPDQPGPVVWVYPFDEYHDMTFGSPGRVEEVFFGDWFMRQAINSGFPVNTVVSTRNLIASTKANPALYAESVLVSIVPDAGTTLEQSLLDAVGRGGKVLLYGPLGHAGPNLLNAAGVALAETIDGELSVDAPATTDTVGTEGYPGKLMHRPLMCAGGIRAVAAASDDPAFTVHATVSNGSDTRIAASARRHPEWQGGVLGWVRGTNSASYRKGGRLLRPDGSGEWFTGPLLMRSILAEFGYDFAVCRKTRDQRFPLVCVARNSNGFFFSGYNPNTTVTQGFRFPQGAPLLIGFETELAEGRSTYTMPRAWHRECRVFVEQAGGELSCVEQPSVQYGVKRRLRVTGLKDATVRFYPEPDDTGTLVRMYANAHYPYKRGKIDYAPGDTSLGHCLEVANVSGSLTIAW
jgi:hypothetical protein